jgi:hypothetical protein
MPLTFCKAGCGADVSKIAGGFCNPCRESLGLPPLPEPVRTHVWTEQERMAFREREARAEDLRRRIEGLPEPEVDDPFIEIHGGPLSLGMANGGGKR